MLELQCVLPFLATIYDFTIYRHAGNSGAVGAENKPVVAMSWKWDERTQKVNEGTLWGNENLRFDCSPSDMPQESELYCM